MPEYRVHYRTDKDSGFVPESERSSEGMREITTDHPIETAEDMIEISRQIGLDGNYTAVEILRIAEIIREDEPEDDA